MGVPPPIQLATFSMPDTLLLMVLALVVFGPRRLPLIGRQIGKLMYEFRKASNDFKFQMEEEFRAAEEADRRKKEEAERQRVLAGAAAGRATRARRHANRRISGVCAGSEPARSIDRKSLSRRDNLSCFGRGCNAHGRARRAGRRGIDPAHPAALHRRNRRRRAPRRATSAG